MRKKHPNKDIEKAIIYAESKGWQVIECKGHAWGILICPKNSSECRCGHFCRMSVWGTPSNTVNHAKHLIQKINGCVFFDEDQ